MNKKSAKLLSILSGCKPNDEELAKRSLISSIVESVEYQSLQSRSSFVRACAPVMRQSILENYSIEQLKQLKDALPAIEEFLQNLIFSLKNGDCPKLKEQDRPSFFQKEALENMAKRLEDGTDKNYTNIAPEDCMTIFESYTIKELGERFLDLPADCDDYDRAIAELLQGRYYCIRHEELQDSEAKYREQVEKYLESAQSGKKRIFSLRLLRFAVMGMFVLIPWCIGRLYGNISSYWTTLSMVGIIVVSIACWIWRER